MKNMTIKAAGNISIQPITKTNRRISIPITTSCAASHLEYSDRIKNKEIDKHIIMKKKETPLHNVLGSRAIIPANIQNNMKNIKNVNCHIDASYKNEHFLYKLKDLYNDFNEIYSYYHC